MKITPGFAITVLLFSLSCVTATAPVAEAPPQANTWSPAQTAEILEKTQTVRLAPDLSSLSDGERTAVAKLLEVGAIFQRIYEQSRHHQALQAKSSLDRLDSAEAADLRKLYRLFQGPIATTLDNRRVAFLPVDPVVPGKNVYPTAVTREELDTFLAANPEKRDSILDLRAVVRRADAQSIAKDLASLDRHPALDTLHPGLRSELRALAASPNSQAFYAVPYSVAWSDEMIRAHALLNEAADAVERDDWEFARYLRNRSRDLLSDDYESGDASWITGNFRNLNAQIGSYEVYDDELFGVKSFFSLSLLVRDRAASEDLSKAIQGLQELENSLPYDQQKRVREDIPVGVYEVIADFGQSRGANTATILPNENFLAQRYGRIILLRGNIMQHPDLFSNTSRAWESAVATAHEKDLRPDGNFYRTLWHEIGHYLGVDTDRSGRDLETALQENSSSMEEMKADLVSLFVARTLNERGYYDAERLRSVYASGIRRTLQNVQPRRDQPYQTMQLMQFNYFLENGLLEFDSDNALIIHYDRYHDVVGSLLREVLAIQYNGDKGAADRFIERYTTWTDRHAKLAENMRAQARYRYTLVEYDAID
jgi:hypothetical protein